MVFVNDLGFLDSFLEKEWSGVDPRNLYFLEVSR